MTIEHSSARHAEPLLIVAIWASAIAFINPRGNFPIDDDWDFALAAWRFAQSGQFHFTPFTAVSLRAQVLWGALWTRLFGESFDVLRMSTLVLAAATLVIVHRTLLRAGVPRFGRVIATLALGFHPIFFWSSATFMTEVPFVFASSVALFCFIRAFDDDDGIAWIMGACAATIVACFVRQTGVSLLAAPLLLAFFKQRKRDVAIIAGTIALFFAMLIFKREWLSGSPQEFAVHFRVWTESTFRLPEQIAVFDHYATFNAQNCALFFLPLVAPLLLLFRGARRTDFAIVGVLALLLFARVQSLIAIGLPMPYFVSRYCCDIFAGNIFVDFGLGPLTLDGAYPFRLPYAMRIAITYASVILAAYLIWAVLRRASRSNASLLALGTALFGSLILFASGLYVDRYSLDSAWPLVIALPLMLPWKSRAVRTVSIASLIAIAIFSTLATQEYFSWNRARWKAIDDLRARGIPITAINAGAEPFYLFELSHGTQRMRRIHQFGVGERPYTVAFEPLRGKRIVARYPFRGWFGLHKGEVLVMSRAAGTDKSVCATSILPYLRECC
ncbi:MAG TPA: glycosyltransferase family 39 protein [Thermoanaerobaculia bacterium]|nr:glycosyltransferase family 39 protein [Thermoanaerobaculia bacterium]